MSYNGNVLVRVNTFTNGKADKNGMESVILNPVAGKCPNRMVLAGTLAANAGFQVGKVYYANCRELEADTQYGRQFRWSVIAEITSPVDIVKMEKELGAAVVFDAGVEAPQTEKEATKADVYADVE